MDTPKSGELVPLLLDTMDLGQALYAIEVRAEAYERTARYMDGEEWEEDVGEFYEILEVRDAEEARSIAEHYRHIETVLNEQWDAWRRSQPIVEAED